MGYYANSIDGAITIPKSELGEVMDTLREAYAKLAERDRYAPELADNLTVIDELNSWGFDYDYDTSDHLEISSFDGKWRTGLDEFITALLVHATEGSAMAFRGEDGEMWRFAKGVEGVQSGVVLWQ